MGECLAPLPSAGEIRIDVRAIGVNPVDAGNRSDGSWAGWSLPCIPGYEAAGVVDLVGPGVDGFAVGDRVVGMSAFRSEAGAYAEFMVVATGQAARLGDRTSFVDAAATPLAGGTAVQMLERLALPPGARLLVVGASGGVGSFLVQLAAAQGLVVIAVARETHHQRLREFGASLVVDYERSTGPTGDYVVGVVDAVADLVGGTAVARWLPRLRTGGQISAIQTPELELDDLLDRNLTFHGVLFTNDGDRTRRLITSIDDASLVAPVAVTLPMEEATKAHRLVEAGGSGGKIVLVTKRANFTDESED